MDPHSMGMAIAVKPESGEGGGMDDEGERAAAEFAASLKGGDVKKIWSAFQALDACCGDDSDETPGHGGEQSEE